MKTLEQEINRIKNEIADISCKLTSGKTCNELVQEILAKLKNISDCDINFIEIS